jgi:hypothetical protein
MATNGNSEGLNGLSAYDLKVRTKDYATAIIRFYSSLPRTIETQVLGKQILRSGRLLARNIENTTCKIEPRFHQQSRKHLTRI